MTTEKREKSLARAIAAFAEYLDVDKVQIVCTPQGLVVRKDVKKVEKK